MIEVTAATRLGENAQQRSARIHELEHDERNLRAELDLAREKLHRLERPYLLAEYSGKNQAVRDAQRDDEMDGDEQLVAVKREVRDYERRLREVQSDRDYHDRLYKVTLAEIGSGR